MNNSLAELMRANTVDIDPLTPKQREAFDMHNSGLTPLAIARTLHLSVGAVKARLARAKRAMDYVK